MLKIHSLKMPNREGEPKIPQREGGSGDRNALKDVVKVDLATTNWNHRAFSEIGEKPSHLTKAFKNGCHVFNVLFARGNEHRHIIHIKQSS
jgi:hypothetical protein